MEEKINSILREYSNCFKDIDCSPIAPGEFVISFNLEPDRLCSSLMFMDRKIYHQRKVIKELIKLYPEKSEQFKELSNRLRNVREQIFKVLQDDYNICGKFINRDTDDVEYIEC